MFVKQEGVYPKLAPNSYWDPRWFQIEQQALQRQAWQWRCCETDSKKQLPLMEVGTRIERVADCVLTTDSPDLPSLRHSLGPLAEELDRHFLGWKLFYRQSILLPVNWKLVIENAVESYHVPSTHPQIFKDYRAEELCDHTLSPFYTRYLDLLSWTREPAGWIYLFLSRLMTSNSKPLRFAHTHVFPNLLFYYANLFSTSTVVEPLGPMLCRLHSFCYVPRQVNFPFLSVPLLKLMQPFMKACFLKILNEDCALLPEVQAGICHATGSGLLSTREERVAAFQTYIDSASQQTV